MLQDRNLLQEQHLKRVILVLRHLLVTGRHPFIIYFS